MEKTFYVLYGGEAFIPAYAPRPEAWSESGRECKRG
jgi:hypothetical protein